MPAIAAHYYFGQEVLKRIPKEYKDIVMENKKIYDFGLQGPDFLFFYKPFKKNVVSAEGRKIHHESGEFFIKNALENMNYRIDKKKQAYLMGFVCHFILDCNLHKKIFLRVKSGEEHNTIEAELDRRIIENYFNEMPYKFKRHELVEINTVNLEWLYGFYPGIPKKTIKKSVKSFYFFSKILNTNTDIKKKFLTKFENRFLGETKAAALIIGKKENQKFYSASKELYLQVDMLINDGIRAIENICGFLKGEQNLSEIFLQKFV